jgi:hypothetical protein
MKDYSLIQYFFWLISGSEISVLKECKNDYNRHATSGALILATCLIASVIAGFAGYTFGGNNWTAAIAIAIIWGYLIFCIDRFMVISLKKNPTIPDEQQPFWKPLSIRLLFAFIIAFFMTIPLYHTFFYTQIEAQIANDNVNELAAHQDKLNSAFNKYNLESEGKSLTKQDSILNSKLNGEYPDPAYIDTFQLYLDCKNNQIPPLEKEKNYWQSKASAIWIYYINNPCDTSMKKPTDCYSAEDWKTINQRNTANKNYESKVKERDNLLTRANVLKGNYILRIKTEIAGNDSLKKANDKSLSAANDTINKRKSVYDKTLESRHTDFVAQFVALWRAAFSDFGTLFLVIMLELAFIMIEIFPTYQKLRTKIGDYDWAIYYNEKSFEEKKKTDFEINMEKDGIRKLTESEIQQQTEQKRKTTEIALNDKLISEVSRIQGDVAQQLLEEWEKQVKEDIPKNVSSFIKSNSNNGNL